MPYDNFINDKRVIVVGPATTLQNTKSKSFIDSFDVVVKTNGMWNIAPEYIEDYGDRCDIVYFNIQYIRDVAINPIALKSRGIKYVCLKWYDGNLETLNKVIPFRIIPNKIDFPFKKSPLMGSLLLNDLLSFSPKSIHLTGMDFYTNSEPYIQAYQLPIVNELIKKTWAPYLIKIQNDEPAASAVHHINDDFLYVYRQYTTTKIITVDDHLLALFNNYDKQKNG